MKKIILCIILSIITSSAEAQVETGYFQARVGKKGLIEIFVQTTTVNSIPVSYGMIFWRTGKRRTYYNTKAALFSIEDLSDGTQSWTRIYEKPSGLVATNPNSLNQTFTANTYVDGKYTTIALSPTRSGVKLGCNFEIVATKFNGDNWESLPEDTTAEAIRYTTFNRQHVTVKNNRIDGKYLRYTSIKDYVPTTGPFTMNQIIPKVAGIKAIAPDLETADGRSVERQYTSLTTITSNRKFSSLHFIQFPEKGNCFGLMTTLTEAR